MLGNPVRLQEWTDYSAYVSEGASWARVCGMLLFKLGVTVATNQPKATFRYFASIPLPRPATVPKTLSLPLRSIINASNTTGAHPAVNYQQHINRGLHRLAMMTGQPLPDHDELLSQLTRLRESTTQLQSQVQNNSSTKEYSSIPLSIDANDVGYFCEIELGNLGYVFNVLVDTGSADLFVGALGCKANDGGSCGNHNFLGPNSSTSLNVTREGWFLFYGSGDVAGFMAYDYVTIAGLSLQGHKFGIATAESDAFTGDDVPFDGILGLAKSKYSPQTISQQKTKSLIEALRDAGQIPQAIVSYSISRLADQENGATEGEMTIGGLNPLKYDPDTLVTLKNVNPSGFWEAPMDDISVNGHVMNFTNRGLIMDTGTTLLIVPNEDAKAIHGNIPGARLDSNTGAYKVPCTTNVSVTLSFGGRQFSIDPRDIAWNPVDRGNPEGDCFSGIHGGNFGLGPGHWLAGDTVLKNLYFSTNVDTDTISLASLASKM
ncbi:hypothetical protein D9758_003998 [Tetrapyrgos nigripes]|uniref:Peptidase A1 domain-containing protein n=1 Tax=Tetrapyrgos nigripes TaxID=182062 RepID=A0A8H5GM13_9AGAR|nr:hypothetical protein D9758_003998 [Tetrapyrgos nigripes]